MALINLNTTKNDLFLQTRDSEDWELLSSVTNDVVLSEKEEIEEDYNRMGDALLHLKISLAQAQNVFLDPNRMYRILHEMNYIEYIGVVDPQVDWQSRSEVNYGTSLKVFGQIISNILSKDIKIYGQLLDAFPSPQNMLAFYQLGDGDLPRRFAPLIFSYIPINRVIQVPRSMFEEFMRPNVESSLSWRVLDPKFDFARISLDYLASPFLDPNPASGVHYDLRILAPFDVPVIECLKARQKLPSRFRPLFQEVLFHLHGGGFIATTSQIHQTYLRKVAQETNRVLISVDYPLAPKQKFSTIVDCVFKSFLYVKSLVNQLCGFTNDELEIVVIGDSAGGNLALALSSWLIIVGQKVPRSLFLAYPALNLSTEYFTPSLLYAFDDYLLNFSMIMLCRGCYLSESDLPEEDFMISPIYTPDSILQKHPPTWIFACENDSLHDDALRLALRLAFPNQKTQQRSPP